MAAVIQSLGKYISHRTHNEYFWAYVFLLPNLFFLGLFLFYPLTQTLVYSFQRFTVSNIHPAGYTLNNYIYLLTRDPLWWTAVKNTVIYTIATVPVNLSVSLLLALLINPLGARAQTFFKGAFYLPSVISVVIIALIWSWIYNPMGGLANYLLSFVGIEPQIWLGDPDIAMLAIVVVSWSVGFGGGVLLYLAALGAIPQSLYEAADLDCASLWSTFRNVTWPLIKPTTLFLIIINTIYSFQVFETVFTMTNGGPASATTTMVYYIYRTGFRNFDFGMASAQSLILSVIIMLVAIFQFRYLSSEIEY